MNLKGNLVTYVFSSQVSESGVPHPDLTAETTLHPLAALDLVGNIMEIWLPLLEEGKGECILPVQEGVREKYLATEGVDSVVTGAAQRVFGVGLLRCPGRTSFLPEPGLTCHGQRVVSGSSMCPFQLYIL